MGVNQFWNFVPDLSGLGNFEIGCRALYLSHDGKHFKSRQPISKFFA